jgi:hypothetical protein
LTILVTVASTERSFSKLKLIKSYLISTMSQEKLNGLAILSIKKMMLENLEYKNLISNFASQKARRIIFKYIYITLKKKLRPNFKVSLKATKFIEPA